MKGIARYDAITAKVRAMYGKRLTQEDFDHIASMKSVTEIADFLRTCPGWRDVFSSLPQTTIHRGELERILKSQLTSEYIKIYKYITEYDKHFFSFFIYKMDSEQILSKMRRLISHDQAADMTDLPEFYNKNSKVDHAALTACSDYPGLLAATHKSIYHNALKALVPSDDIGLPDYTAVSIVLQSTYYAAIQKYISLRYKGSMKELLHRGMGEEIDLLNILHVVRLKKYYPDSKRNPIDILYPLFYNLKPEFFETLFAAPDLSVALDMIKKSYYGNLFKGVDDFGFIEQLYSKWVFKFNKNQLIMGRPSVYKPLAYLALKELEIKRLISTVECVRYGIPAKSAPIAI